MTEPYFNVNINELLENQVVNVDSGNRIINNNPDFRYTHRRDKKIMMKLSIEDVMDHGLLYVTLQDIKLPMDNNGVKSLGEFNIGALTIDLNTKKITEFTLDTEEFELLQLTEEDKRKMLKGLGRKMLLLALEIQAVLPREMIRKYELTDINELVYIPKRSDTSLVNEETLVKMGFKPRSWHSGIFHQSIKYLKSTIKDSLRDLLLVDNGFNPPELFMKIIFASFCMVMVSIFLASSGGSDTRGGRFDLTPQVGRPGTTDFTSTAFKTDNVGIRPLVVFGDLHGMNINDKFLPMLKESNIVQQDATPETCNFNPNFKGDVLFLGDIVDRGVDSLEDLRCVLQLKQSAIDQGLGNRVDVLMGNHEHEVAFKGTTIWANPRDVENPERLAEQQRIIIDAIQTGNMQAVARKGDVTFVHAGFTPQYVANLANFPEFESYVTRTIEAKHGENATLSEHPDELMGIVANYTNLKLQQHATMVECTPGKCDISSIPDDPMYSLGQGRGGGRGAVGGPIWADARTDINTEDKSWDKIGPQVVGHNIMPPGVRVNNVYFADTGGNTEVYGRVPGATTGVSVLTGEGSTYDTYNFLEWKGDFSNIIEMDIDDTIQGFAPVATGSYGCVFYPRLLTFRERRNADRGTALVSKVFHDPDDAWNEWNEQVNIKERLRAILLSDDEELRYIFATGEPSRIGTQLAAGDLRGPDGKTIANTCTNFPNGIIEPDFLKLDIANAGRDLKYWMTPQVVTPDLLRDILYRFSRPGGLLDSIRLMNQQGVLHGDIKEDNVTMKEDGETISIIDWGLTYHPGMDWRIDDPWPQPMPVFQYNIPAVSLLFKSQVRARMALAFRNPPSRQGWFNYNTGVLDRDELIQLFWPIVRDDIFDGTNERNGHLFQLEKDFETIARFSEEHMTDVIDTDLMNVINNDQTLSAGFVNPPLISKRAREYASVVINQLIHIYQTNPSWFDPLNDEGLRNYWHNVYLYNADIWGAMNVILKIVDIIRNDPDYETSDTTHLVHALNMTVMLPDSQSSPINIEDLKALLMTYGDSIGDGYVFDEDDEDDDIDIIYEEDSEEESENSYYDPDDFVVDSPILGENYYDPDEDDNMFMP